MPSPIPVTRLLPKDFYPSLDIGACSSPLTKYTGECTLKVPSQRFHGKVVSRLWSSVVYWKELSSMQPVGSGGFGSVYKAEYFGETVAVKKVKKCSKNKLASRQSFWAELNAAHLRHKNIVRIVAATTCVPATPENENNIGTIVMEYVGSRNLHQVIYGCADALGEDRWMGYSTDIAKGLHFLHCHGVIHLDLKPANVLVSKENVCKIVDFGSSLKLDNSDAGNATTNLSHIGGTYTHRAPELLKGQNVTPKADIFSFGITLWQMITRKPPYTGERQQIMYAVVAYNLRPSVNEETFFQSKHGDACKTLLSQCWKGEAHSRPTAHEVQDCLEKLQLQSC